MKLYKKIPRLPDELLMSWLYRLAEANNIDLKTLLNEYVGQESRFKRMNYNRLENVLCTGEDVLDLFISTGTYCFEGLADNDERRMLEIARARLEDNPGTIAALDWQGVGSNGYRLCPECFAEDKEKYGVAYLHRAHALSGVCVCYKHGCGLVRTKKQTMIDLSCSESVEMNAEQSLAQKYAVLCKKILDAEFSFNVCDMSKLLRNNVDGALAKWLEKYNRSGYAGISNKQYGGCYYFYNGYSTTMQVALPMLMYAYDGDIEKLFADLCNITAAEHTVSENFTVVKKRSFIKRYKHSRCGKTFHQVDKGISICGCPTCKKLTIQDLTSKLTEEQYEYVGRSDDGSKGRFLHKKCGRISEFTLESLLIEHRSMCECESRLTMKEASSRAESKNCDLLDYKNTNSIAKFRCRKCGNVFEQNFGWFCRYGSPCEYCNERERKDFESRVRKLYGDEYTVAGQYVTNTVDIKIRHNVCGMEYEYSPMRFLDGRVSCRYCAEKLKESKTDGRVGETNIAKNGMRMTIIAFRKYNDIDVQFDDGTVREHIRYEHFLTGDVINKNVGGARSIKTREQVLGMQVQNVYNGKMMKLIEYRSARDVTIEVEDGTVFTTRLTRFRTGRVMYWLSKNYKVLDKDKNKT